MQLSTIHEAIPNLTDREIVKVILLIDRQEQDAQADLLGALGLDGAAINLKAKKRTDSRTGMHRKK